MYILRLWVRQGYSRPIRKSYCVVWIIVIELLFLQEKHTPTVSPGLLTQSVIYSKLTFSKLINIK